MRHAPESHLLQERELSFPVSKPLAGPCRNKGCQEVGAPPPLMGEAQRVGKWPRPHSWPVYEGRGLYRAACRAVSPQLKGGGTSSCREESQRRVGEMEGRRCSNPSSDRDQGK